MSEIDILTDVIEELHDSRRFLGPGEIPDRAIFRHVKTLWQLLLGIDETKFDSHNYEVFDLAFESIQAKFVGLTYLGADESSVAENIGNAVGFSTKSLKIVQLLDEEEADDTEETSVSFKLSLLNRIRYILFEHHMMVKDFFNDDELKLVIVSFIEKDILHLNSDLKLSMRSNNQIFNACYQECLEAFLFQEDYTIEKIAKGILSLFRRKAGVAYFFDADLVLDFQSQMTDLLKRIFRNDHVVIEEIDDFFTYNPVLPILKPIYRKVALQIITSDAKDEKLNTSMEYEETDKDTQILERLNMTLLKQILYRVTQDTLRGSEDNPITLKWFPQIIQYYCDSLKHEGVTNIENDVYITMIKKVAIQWIDSEIDTASFLAQLSDLSLIPTAMPYLFRGVLFPTVHMRMALYTVKENIRLYETYFDLWHGRTLKSISINSRYCKWTTVYLKVYFQKWKKKKKITDHLEEIDTNSITKIKINNFYQNWKQRMLRIRRSENIADLRCCETYFSLWKSKSREFQHQMELAKKFNNHNLTRNFMILWKTAKECSFPEVLDEFAKLRKSSYFQLWKSLFFKLQNNYLEAEEFKQRFALSNYFRKWKRCSTTPLLKLQELEKTESIFILKIFFSKWTTRMKLISYEKKFQISSNAALTRRFFLQWNKIKKLVDRENTLINSENVNLTLFYLRAWKRSYIVSKQAEKFYKQKSVDRTFKKWRLKYIERQMSKKFELIVLENSLKTWKLKATLSQYNKKRKEITLEKAFINWVEKFSSLSVRLVDCLETYPFFKIATYFDYWKKATLKHRQFENAADSFRKLKLQKINKLILRWSFCLLKAKYNKIQNSFLNLHSFKEYYRQLELKRYFSKFKEKKRLCDFYAANAENFYKMITLTRFYNTWLTQFDRVSALQEVLISKQDTDDVHLLMQILSKLQLKMMKVQTDMTNAEKFRDRWERIKTKTFFELWKLKQSSRNSPTPTARAGINQSSKIRADSDSNLIPELNPYIDLAPRDRGSPEYKPPYMSRMQSVLTGDVSQYEIEQQVDEKGENKTNQSALFGAIRRTPAKFRTPTVRKSNSRLLVSSAIRSTPDSSSIFTSAERVRKRNLEERVSRYRLLRSPPKIGSYRLESVEESHQEERISQNSSIFDTSSESIGSSTPIKKLGIIEL